MKKKLEPKMKPKNDACFACIVCILVSWAAYSTL
jgi:hypothetical protein